MTHLLLRLRFTSDATLGRGDGVAGLVDTEVQHDEAGFPYLAGRTIKGLLVEECASLLFALEQGGRLEPWLATANTLFGRAGSQSGDRSCLHASDASLPADLRQVVLASQLPPAQVLESLTAIRRQSAVDPQSEAPKDETLRALRVVLRETVLISDLYLAAANDEQERYALGLLAACVKALRRAGTGRNRGRGELRATLHTSTGEDVTDQHFELFAKEVA